MTSRERLLTAYRRGRPDRVPINVRGVHVGDPGWVRARHPSYRPLIDLVAAECDLLGGYGADKGWLLTASDAVTFERSARQDGDWIYHETVAHTPKGPLSYVVRASTREYCSLTHKFWLRDETEVERFLSVPYVPPRPDLSTFSAVEAAMGQRGLVAVGTSDPIGFVHELLGSTAIAFWSIERPATIDMLVDLFTQRIVDWVDHVSAGGVRSVFAFGGAEYCSPPLVAPPFFRRWVTEPMKRITARIHAAGGLVHVHCHGPISAVLEQFAEMGADVLHPIEAPTMGDVTLAEAKRRIGRDVCLEGNIQIGDLYGGTEAEVRDAVKRAIDEGAHDGGFVLCPTASPFTAVLPDRVVRNYLAMIETGLEYGRY